MKTALTLLLAISSLPANADIYSIYPVNPITRLQDYSQPMQQYEVREDWNRVIITPMANRFLPDYSRSIAIERLDSIDLTRKHELEDALYDAIRDY